MKIYYYFMLFIIYSILGWFMEVIVSFVQHKRFINRGFLIGPYCPIYGYGCISMIIFLEKYLDDPITLFIMAVFMCSILEYLTSYFMEKLFNARWWDYSNKKFNINGRICLETMIPFGILGCLVLYVLNPFVTNLLNKLPEFILIFVSVMLCIIYIIDNILSFKIISNFKNTARKIAFDSTEEITRKVKEVLTSKSILSRRLVNAFPKFNIGKINIKKFKRR